MHRGTKERITVDFFANNGREKNKQSIEREKKPVILEFYTYCKGLSKMKAK